MNRTNAVLLLLAAVNGVLFFVTTPKPGFPPLNGEAAILLALAVFARWVCRRH
jgi:hypothetical protein